jgi:hypothetical protein
MYCVREQILTQYFHQTGQVTCGPKLLELLVLNNIVDNLQPDAIFLEVDSGQLLGHFNSVSKHVLVVCGYMLHFA